MGVAQDTLLLGFCGRIILDKGIQDVLAVVRRLQEAEVDFRLILIGVLECKRAKRILAQLEEQPEVTYIGYSPTPEWYFPCLDLLLLPTRREGLPTVVLEAAAAGVPSITTTATGAIDSVVPGRTGWITDVGDVNQMVAIISCLLRDRRLLHTAGMAGRQRVLHEYSQERVWEAWGRFLQEANSGAPRRAWAQDGPFSTVIWPEAGQHLVP